jgi:signal transduction histidine kinase/arylsulfatase A-like enzyme
MIDRLWLRLMLAMAVAIGLAVGAVALLVNRATSESFVDYVEDVSTARAQRVESVLARQYQRHKSWSGVDPMVQLVADLSGQRVILADRNGQIVADSQNRLIGQRVPSNWANEPIIISHQEQPVGSVYLDPLRPLGSVDNRGQTFLAATNRYLLWAVGFGLLAACLLSIALSRWLAAPLEALTRAARRMERGQLGEQIEVKIGGEVGALAQAFNSTAASLARLERLRQQMVSDIAHELRTPLTNIRGYIEGIQDGVAEPDEATLGVLQYELTQLTRLVDDLQELALVEAGQLKLSRQSVDLERLIAQEVLGFRPQAEAREVELTTRLRPGLPEISADPGRLGQVLRNMLRNALTHTPTGGRITVSLEQEQRQAVLRVADTGGGIPPEHLPHIFERLYRGDSARTRAQHGGYGLGLTICRELVQAHGGTIDASSVVGQGSEFVVRLPLDPPREVEEQPEPEARPFRWRELLQTGALVGALFGAAAGLVESVLLASDFGRGQAFADLFGYAILVDALIFGLLGLLATLVIGLAARATGRRFGLAQQVAAWTPVGFLLIGAVSYACWLQLHRDQQGTLAPQALFVQVIIFGLAACLALLAGALLNSRRGRPVLAQLFGLRWAPLVLAVLAGLALAGVTRDLGERGLGLGSPVAAAAGGNRGAEAGRQPNVLLVTIDSLRADHLGYSGYAKARTPTLDRLAAGGVQFSNALANQPDSPAAHGAIFTGLYPASHGLRRPMMDRLKPDAQTLAERLQAGGYTTAGLYSWVTLDPAFSGLDRGFQEYRDRLTNRPAYLADERLATFAATYERLRSLLTLPSLVDQGAPLVERLEDQVQARADRTTDGAIAWLRDYQARQRGGPPPFLLWVHYRDPHYPYEPPPPFDRLEPDDCDSCLDGSMASIRQIQGERPELSAAQVNRLLQLYDGEIAFTDRELGRLLQFLEDLDLDQNTLVVVVGTHGATFGEHGQLLSGGDLRDPEVHVPLLLYQPGRLPAGRSVDAAVQQVDAMPTILELAGLGRADGSEGQSLLPLLERGAATDDRFAVAELADRTRLAITTRDWSLLKSVQTGATALYRVVDDLQDQSGDEPEVVAELERVLQQWRDAHP